jgi:hypothetical protein
MWVLDRFDEPAFRVNALKALAQPIFHIINEVTEQHWIG